MQLQNRFAVALPPERAWAVLTDVARVAPCLPGARLDSIDGDEFRGTVRVRVGPVSTSYRGVARFVDLDRSAHRLVLEAAGRDGRGQGTAQARVTVRLSPDGGDTDVHVTTDLALSGKVAQLGSGLIREVSKQLIDEFARRLEAAVLGTPGGAAAASSDEIDLLRVAAITRWARPATATAVGFVAGLALVRLVRLLSRSNPRRRRRRAVSVPRRRTAVPSSHRPWS